MPSSLFIFSFRKMTKKIIYGFLFVIGWAGLILGTSSSSYYKLITNNLLKNYDHYGDLYRFSNLPQFKMVAPECKRTFSSKADSLKQNIALYTVGDSFLETWRINNLDFDYQKYETTHWYIENREIILDTTKTNILLLECVERHARERFGIVPLNFKVVKYYGEGSVPMGGRKIWLKNKWNDLKASLFTPEANDHLDHVMFSGDWFLPIKEAKASFNLKVFDRVHASAAISNDRKHIFYYIDKDSTRINSSFSKLPEAEIDRMVANMDSTVAAYKRAGFDHVIVNIIPNKASILAPTDGVYNHLVERFEAKAKDKFPIVSIYHQFAAEPLSVFGHNETHWSCYGRSIWINNVNTKIAELQLEKKTQ
jgi:hypothetical protein